jgi:hypothetical protein
MNKWALALGPEVIENLHKRVVTIAQEKKVVEGRKMRVDTTVVETNIHYPTDSSLLGDGVRVLTRAMKRIAAIAGEVGAKLRDRSRSVKYRILGIGRAARNKGGAGKEKLQQGYGKLLAATSRVVGQAKPPPGIPRIFALPGLLVNLSGRNGSLIGECSWARENSGSGRPLDPTATRRAWGKEGVQQK